MTHTRAATSASLEIAKHCANQNIVNEAMRAIMRNAFSVHFYNCVEKAISYTTSIEVLEDFINNVNTSQKLKDMAYERAMRFMEEDDMKV